MRNEGVRDYFVAMIRVFRCGDLEVKGFTDGSLKTSLDFVLGMERAASEELVGGTDGGALFIPVNNFLFQRDGATVLIDAGAGNTMQPTLGKLPANLKAAGIDPADVTHIVLTHMHPDHANGLVDEAGKPVYPNADKSPVKGQIAAVEADGVTLKVAETRRRQRWAACRNSSMTAPSRPTSMRSTPCSRRMSQAPTSRQPAAIPPMPIRMPRRRYRPRPRSPSATSST